MRRSIGRTIIVLLAVMLAIAVIPKNTGSELLATEGGNKTQSDTFLGTSGIADPVAPADQNTPWQGSYVYFGTSNSNPIKFRVLASDTTAFGDSTLFLDSDVQLCFEPFDRTEPYTIDWKDSTIREKLNGELLNSWFSSAEQDAIVTSKQDGGKAYPAGSYAATNYGNTVGVNDKLFLLDAADVLNPAYGYTTITGNENDETKKVANRSKSGSDWLLRAGYGYDSSNWGFTGRVDRGGNLYDDRAVFYNGGVAPALNVDLDKVLFSSLISGKIGETGAEYKLTLINDNITIAVPSSEKVTASGSTISVPFAIGGKDANKAQRVTVLILDKEYKTGNSANAKILYYALLEGSYFKKNDTCTFTLPSELDVKKWGSKYHVYIIAENENGDYKTDFASVPYELKKPSKNSEPTAKPTSKPANKPTEKPEPTATPTSKPVSKPTSKPTSEPTAIPTGSSTGSLTLDKTSASVVCGDSFAFKATLKGPYSNLTWKSSDEKIATVSDKGRVTGKMAGAVTITCTAGNHKATCKVTVLYKDVTNTKDFWFEPTNYLTEAGVVKGYDKQTKFKPANECTRAQMVTFIWRLMGEPKPKANTCKFSDVKAKDYFYKACIWGNENHIVEGYKDGTFGPQIVCARKHAVTFLWRLAGQPKPSSTKNKFTDVKEKDYFYKATLWASEKKILAGYSDGTFRPNGNCLRRQMVTFLYKYDKFVNEKG